MKTVLTLSYYLYSILNSKGNQCLENMHKTEPAKLEPVPFPMSEEWERHKKPPWLEIVLLQFTNITRGSPRAEMGLREHLELKAWSVSMILQRDVAASLFVLFLIQQLLSRGSLQAPSPGIQPWTKLIQHIKNHNDIVIDKVVSWLTWIPTAVSKKNKA